MATVATPVLDHHAALALERTGVVCEAAGMARCIRCSAPMRAGRVEGEAVYRCLVSHVLARKEVDDALWEYYLAHVSKPIHRTITDPAQRRGFIRSAFSAIVVDPEHATAAGGRLIKAVYPRLH